MRNRLRARVRSAPLAITDEPADQLTAFFQQGTAPRRGPSDPVPDRRGLGRVGRSTRERGVDMSLLPYPLEPVPSLCE